MNDQTKPAGEALQVAKLRQTIAFFASVIKSGEPWTEHTQKAYDEAMAATPETALAEVLDKLKELGVDFLQALVDESPASTCTQCGEEIRYTGKHWEHTKSRPRHIATPPPAGGKATFQNL